MKNEETKLRTQTEPVTQARFDLLPALLTAGEVKTVTGLNDGELSALASVGTIEARRRPVRPGCKRAYAKYTKASVAKYAGMKI